ncbi:MAG: hypothetical protein LBR14_04850 [Clostridiales Family XIII bacterium]|jgi:hypothetical protein|nr:hypothetical protein [Clostridiales Family XIII bacterium]
MRYKKVGIIILVLLLFFGFEKGCADSKPKIVPTYTKFVFNPVVCGGLFYKTPEDTLAGFENGQSRRSGHYRTAEIDEEGNLVVELSDADIEFWREDCLSAIDEVVTSINEEGTCHIYVSDDHKELEFSAPPEYYMTIWPAGSAVFPSCGILQVLDGTAPEDWSLDMTFINSETGHIVAEFKIPGTELSINREMWDV